MKKWLMNKLIGLSFLMVAVPTFAAIGLMVPYGAGGATDFQARIVTMTAEDDDALGEPVFVMNKPGAGGRVGWSWFAKSAPTQGSILGVFNVPHFIAQSIGDEVPYSVDSFEPIVTWGADPAVLVVPTSSVINSVADFREACLAGDMKVSGAGLLVGHHIAALQLKKYAEFDFTYIPHPTGGAGAIAGVISGEFDAGINNMSDAIRAVKSGNLKIIAIFASNRHEYSPETPTFIEAGISGIGDESVNYRGVMVPKGVPDAKLRELEAQFLHMLKDLRVSKKMRTSGSPMWILNRDETISLWKAQQKSLKILLEEL